MPVSNSTITIVDSSGVSTVIAVGAAIPTSGVMVMGSDGTNTRFISTDTSGRVVVIGQGVAGTPAGGVISIQGVSGGQAIPISGSITATNPSVSTTGAAPPASATYIGGNDGTNLVGFKMKPASTAAVATDPALVVAISPNRAADPTVTGNLGALNATVAITGAGNYTIGGTITGTWVGTITAQGTIDGVNWFTVRTANKSTNDIIQTYTANDSFEFYSVAGCVQLRLIMSAYTSGTAVVTFVGSQLATDAFLNYSGTDGDVAPPLRHLSLATLSSDGTLHAFRNTNVDPLGTEYALITRSLTYATGKSGFQPDPTSISTSPTQLSVDTSGSLQIRGPVVTDEESFRDDFPNASLTTAFTGTLTFVNGSTAVTGTGTLFTTETNNQDYIRLTADANTALVRVASVESDTALTLSAPYTGTSTTGAAVTSNWFISAGGGSFTVSSSIVQITAPTTNGAITALYRSGDFLPFVVSGVLSVSQRITNQNLFFGFQDIPTAPVQQAVFLFTGTTNTQVICRTSFSAAAADTQSTTVTIPSSGTTATAHTYEIDLSSNICVFLIDSTIVAQHSLHLPQPYTNLSIATYIQNTGVAGSATTINLDALFFQNTDQLQVGSIFRGDPLAAQIVGKAPSGVLQSVNTDGNGSLTVSSPGLAASNAGFANGHATLAATTQAAVRATTYTEQATNAQRSIVSASANDTAAGTGARTALLTYYDQTGAGPSTETITLNGTTAVNTVSTTICFIESIKVLTVGSTGSNVGVLSLKAATAGGGATIWTVAATDNQTFGAHHYTPTGKTSYITGISCGHNGTTTGSGGLFIIKSVAIGVANAVESQVSDEPRLYGQSSTFARIYSTPIRVVGPARTTIYVTPETATSTTYRSAFDFYDQ